MSDKKRCLCYKKTKPTEQCDNFAFPPDYLCGFHNAGKCGKTIPNTYGSMTITVPVSRPTTIPSAIASKPIVAPVAPRPTTIPSTVGAKTDVFDGFGDLNFDFDPSELDDVINENPAIPQQKPMDINAIKIEAAIDRVADSIYIIMDIYKQKKSKLEVTKLMDALCKILTSIPPGKLSLKQALTPYISKVLRDLPEHITKVPQQHQKDYLRKIIFKSAGTLKKLFDNVCSYNDGGSRTSDRINEETILSELYGIEKADEELTDTLEANVLNFRLNAMTPSIASQPIGAKAQPEKVKTKRSAVPIAVSK